MPYQVVRAFPHLEFKAPVTITGAPRTRRLFVAQVMGEVFSFPEDESSATPELFLDLKSIVSSKPNVYGMTFHPDYPSTPFVYIFYVHEGDHPDRSVIARFRVDTVDPPRVDPTSQRVLFRWLAGGHNGCCLKFGPDGYLYISTGDGTGPSPPDELGAGQDVSNVLSCILRIDVDRSEEGRHYAIPDDNPFIHLEGVRPEIWAYGFRNPWKMSFDRVTGDLWVGDVGWDTWELIYRVERGGNYGWSITEGEQPVNPNGKRGPTPILPPTTQHDHSEALSITGGFVYRGKRHPELYGAYVYGDYQTGKIWALHYDGAKVTSRIELADSTNQIVGWGETLDGELYFIDYEVTNRIYRLEPNDAADQSEEFPRNLSETGLFSSVKDHAPAPGVLPYSVNAEAWADGTDALRLLAIPGTSQIAGDLKNVWEFPDGSVLARTVLMNVDSGSATVPRRLETQILHYEDDTWRAFTYVWNESQDDATLAPTEGMQLQINARPSSAATSQDKFVWHVPSRAECRVCHTVMPGTALTMNLRQLNRNQGKRSDSQSPLVQWHNMGLFASDLPDNLHTLPRLVNPYDESANLEERARSYLHVNCAHCHRNNGGGLSRIRLGHDLPLSETKTINADPVQGSFGLPDAKIISAGDPFRSVLIFRMSKVGRGHMPQLGATLTDTKGLRLMHDWIADGTSLYSVEDASPAHSGTSTHNLDAVAQLARLNDRDREVRSKAIKDLLSTSLGALTLAWHLHAEDVPPDVRQEVFNECGPHTETNIRDLIEAFLPASQRTRRLGSEFDLSEVLLLKGEIQRGRKVYWYGAGLGCVACHRISGQGGDVGPDLSDIGKRLKPADLLDSIAVPSKRIEPPYRSYTLATDDGRVHTGVIVEKNDEVLTFRTVDNKLLRIPQENVDALKPGEKSLMPEHLLRELTAQEAADLVAYLASLQ